MNLLMSDILLNSIKFKRPENIYIDLSKKKIANCTGCFNCWIKTPGRCIIRDDATEIYPIIAQSDKIIYVTKIKYGSYDTTMKTMLERSIPIQQAFIRLYRGETHHVQRDVKEKDAVIIAYGDISAKDREVFKKLTERNSRNMLFKNYRLIFTNANKLERQVEKEVSSWEN